MDQVTTIPIFVQEIIGHVVSAGIVVSLGLYWVKRSTEILERVDKNVSHMREQHDTKDSYGRPAWFRDPTVADILRNQDKLLTQIVSVNERQTRLLEDHDRLLKEILTQSGATGRQLDRIEHDIKPEN